MKFKKLHPNAVTPERAHASDAGLDLYATSKQLDEFGNTVYGFGWAVEIPVGYVGLLLHRSSNSKHNQILTNCVGTIDAPYRGELMAKMKFYHFANPGRIDLPEYEVGDKICQLVVVPIYIAEVEVVDELSETDRGSSGYGSTGHK